MSVRLLASPSIASLAQVAFAPTPPKRSLATRSTYSDTAPPGFSAIKPSYVRISYEASRDIRIALLDNIKVCFHTTVECHDAVSHEPMSQLCPTAPPSFGMPEERHSCPNNRRLARKNRTQPQRGESNERSRRQEFLAGHTRSDA